MKKLLNILSLVLAATCLSSCGGEDKTEPFPFTRALMEVELETGGAEDHDLVHTVRYLVFDNASSYPTLDFNERIVVDQDARESTRFKTLFEVGCNPDKMVVVVVNEPGSLRAALDRVTSPDGLEDITFLMADMFNNNHSAPKSSGIAMTGVMRGISVSENNTLNRPAQVQINLERAVARIELWLKKDDSVDTAWEDTDTEVSIMKSHGEGYLAAGTKADKTRYQADATKNFGHFLTVNTPSVNSITYKATAKTAINNNERLVCAFYTPERVLGNENARMRLVIKNIHTTYEVKNYDGVLKEFVSDDLTKLDIDTIKRNNVYKIVGKLKSTSLSLESTVLPWTNVGQSVIIDPQYFLKVTQDKLYLPTSGGAYTSSIVVETNYGKYGEDRGFPKGIIVDSIEYYDQAGYQLNSAYGDKYGWLNVGSNQTEYADYYQAVIGCVALSVSDNNKGCYAIVNVKAGNLTKKIKIIRAS